MRFKEIMDTMLPPVVENGKLYEPGINEHHLGGQRSYGKHQGVDFNYHKENGGRLGQNGINLSHPSVYSPVEGAIVDVNESKGQIKIRDLSGYTHEINHLDSVATYKKGDRIYPGDCIGKMGNKNCKDQHVDYKIYKEVWDRNGHSHKEDLQDPEKFFIRNYEPAPGEDDYGEGYWPSRRR